LVPLVLAGSVAGAQKESRSAAYAYVGDRYIITAEVAGERSFVVNFINLSDFVIVVQPNDLIYKGASERFYIGQVYEKGQKDTRGEVFRYSASTLIRGKTFAGLTVIGAFRELDQIEELSIRIGSKRFYLEPMDKIHFEQLAAKIGEVDLEAASARAALQAANIPEIGQVKSADGSSEWERDWEGQLLPDGTNPPRVLSKPDIVPTEEAKRKNISGRIKLSATISKDGGLVDVKVVKGLGHGLDERAVEAVKNSWVFLPATKNGEVLETQIAFDVEIPPSSPKRP
jgi:TonB family protein